MAQATTDATSVQAAPVQAERGFRQRRPLLRQPALLAALGSLALIVLAAILAPWISPHNPLQQDLGARVAGPSAAHLLGTDDVGRDVLSRLIWGTRPVLVGLLIGIVTTCVIGVPWGLVSGYAGGAVDLVLMRVADAVLVLPGLVLAIAITGTLGPNLTNAMLAVGIVFSPTLARIVRSGVLRVRDRDFVVVTRMYGLSASHRMLRHVLPSVVGPTMVQITILAGLALLVETALAFLGIAVTPPDPSWGDSLATAFRFIIVDPAAVLAPGITVSLTILALYRVGDSLRDALDMGLD
ncbi:MAG: ABC transporter permease [bacterium]|jgi:peptide/nickel transport system permease protein|nr:ABC transporter permease [bacterium]